MTPELKPKKVTKPRPKRKAVEEPPKDLRRSSRSKRGKLENVEVEDGDSTFENDDEDMEEELDSDDEPRMNTRRGGRKRARTESSNSGRRSRGRGRSSGFSVDDSESFSGRPKRQTRTPTQKGFSKSTVVDEDDDEDDDKFLASLSKKKTNRRGKKKFLSEPFVTCRNMLEDLMDQDDTGPFNTPVDSEALNIPDYKEIVKIPMDLGSIWVSHKLIFLFHPIFNQIFIKFSLNFQSNFHQISIKIFNHLN